MPLSSKFKLNQRMNHTHYNLWITRILGFFLLVSLFSCIPQRKLRYLQQTAEEQKVDTNQKTAPADLNYRLKSKDEIYIKVYSLDPKMTALFNGDAGTANMYNSDLGLYLNSYTLNDSGYIYFPALREVKLLGLSLDEAQLLIEERLNQYLQKAMVTVKLAGFKITLIGEVKRPGRYNPYVSQLNVLEALALAGDMTSYGNRTNVTIVREENGVQKIYKINLLDQNLITSKYFYLLPNDVLYVESLNAKTWGFEQFPYTLILSSLTTFIAMMTLIATLK